MDENLKVGPRDPFDGRTFEERTQPSPPEVTEEDVREWTSWVLAGLSEPEVDYHDATDRLLTDRAQDKERIGELEAALREIMEDHSWRDELWRFTDDTEDLLRALLAPTEEAQRPAFLEDVEEKFERDTKPALRENAELRGEEAQHVRADEA